MKCRPKSEPCRHCCYYRFALQYKLDFLQFLNKICVVLLCAKNRWHNARVLIGLWLSNLWKNFLRHLVEHLHTHKISLCSLYIFIVYRFLQGFFFFFYKDERNSLAILPVQYQAISDLSSPKRKIKTHFTLRSDALFLYKLVVPGQNKLLYAATQCKSIRFFAHFFAFQAKNKVKRTCSCFTKKSWCSYILMPCSCI